MNIELLHSVSIRGRYFYGYCCLLNTIQKYKLEPIYKPLDIILKSFVETDQLDDWQGRVDEFMPSRILEVDFPLIHCVASTDKKSNGLIKYYSEQPFVVLNIIEELIWLGISNLYGGFDSKHTFPYIKQIVKYLEEENIDLPNEGILKIFPVSEDRGWGERIDIDSLLIAYGYIV